MEHLRADDFIKYLNTADESDEYLVWMNEKQEHLGQCELCQKMLQRAIAVDSFDEAANLGVALRLASCEDALRRELLVEKMRGMVYANWTSPQRLLQFAEMINEGQAWSRPVCRDELRRQGRAARTIRLKGGRAGGLASRNSVAVREEPVSVSLRDNVLRVEIASRMPADVLVALNPQTGEDCEPIFGKARYDSASKKAVAEFHVDNPAEKYQLYLEKYQLDPERD